MLAGTLSYPFALLGNRPATVIFCLLFGVAVDTAVYYAFSTAGLFAPGPTANGVARALRDLAYFGICSALTAPASALILVRALIGLGMREPERGITFGDCLRFLWVSLLAYGFVTGPAFVLKELGRTALVPHLGSAAAAAFTASFLIAFVPQALFLFRFAFAWPHTLAIQSPVFFRAWALTRDRFWTMAGVLTPVLIMQTLIIYGGSVLAAQLAYRLPPSLPMYAEANHPGVGWLIYVVLFQVARVLGSFYLAAANVYLYARLTPRPVMLARVFT